MSACKKNYKITNHGPTSTVIIHSLNDVCYSDWTYALLSYLPSFWFHAKFREAARAQVYWLTAKRHSRVARCPDHVCQHVPSTHAIKSLRILSSCSGSQHS